MQDGSPGVDECLSPGAPQPGSKVNGARTRGGLHKVDFLRVGASKVGVGEVHGKPFVSAVSRWLVVLHHKSGCSVGKLFAYFFAFLFVQQPQVVGEVQPPAVKFGAAGPAAVSGIQAILNGISGVSSQQPNNNTPALPAGLPDLSALLGLVNSSTTNAALITNLLNSVQIVNTNFTGTTQAALISLLKVSYSQAYNQINNK